MSGRSIPDGLRLPDQAIYNRAPLRRAIVANLQHNAQSYHNHRLRQIVAATNLWTDPTASPGWGTWPQFLVGISDDATELVGVCAYVASGSERNIPRGYQWQATARFQSERGGAGVASGLDVVTGTSVTTDFRSQIRQQNHAFDYPANYSSVKVPSQQGVSEFWFLAYSVDIFLTPNLANSREQRITVQLQDPNGDVARRHALWGAWIWEMVPQV